MSALDDFRRDKDAFFRDDPRSPLTPEQRAAFTGLDYFPQDEGLRIDAEMDTDVEPGVIEMETTSGTPQRYTRAGTVTFEVDGEPATVTLYASADGHAHGLFLPFRDATSGRETYGAGRYLDLDPPHDGRVEVDFNLAYNPYCAYDAGWSCPLPPGENWLGVPIRGGERDFPGGATG